MFASLLKWLAGGGITVLGQEITRAYKAKLDAKNDAERIAADKWIAELEAERASILAAQRDRFERWVRIGFAVPFVIYIWKLVLWDKVLGLGVTDPLSPMLTQIMWTVIGGYFVISTVRIFRR